MNLWDQIVGKLPAWLLTIAASLALIAFTILVGVTLYAYAHDDSITLASLDFGKTKPKVSRPDLSFVVDSKRIGPNGVEGPNFNPGYFKETSGGVGNFIDVPESADSQICTLSNIIGSGICELHYVSPGAPWRIHVAGGAQCRATCFKIGVSK
jgi:hypothetical protein